jgi:hypothetical protein
MERALASRGRAGERDKKTNGRERNRCPRLRPDRSRRTHMTLL